MFYIIFIFYFIPSFSYSKDDFCDKLENYLYYLHSRVIYCYIFILSILLKFVASVNLTKTVKTKRPRNHTHVCLVVSHKSVSIFTYWTKLVTVFKCCVFLILRTFIQL